MTTRRQFQLQQRKASKEVGHVTNVVTSAVTLTEAGTEGSGRGLATFKALLTTFKALLMTSKGSRLHVNSQSVLLLVSTAGLVKLLST